MPLHGEDEFLRLLDRRFGARPHPAVTLGRGDDAAILRPGAWCVTLDALVDGVHFRRGLISPRDLGVKAFRVTPA